MWPEIIAEKRTSKTVTKPCGDSRLIRRGLSISVKKRKLTTVYGEMWRTDNLWSLSQLKSYNDSFCDGKGSPEAETSRFYGTLFFTYTQLCSC